jgi:hypothetical protein
MLNPKPNFMKKLSVLIILFIAFSCENESPQKSTVTLDPSLLSSLQGKDRSGARIRPPNSSELLTAVNASLASRGLQIEASMFEYFGSDQLGKTVFFSNRGNKQLGADFVPGDPRRGGDADIKYVIDNTESTTGSGLTSAQTNGAIISAMNTWDAVGCSSGLTINTFGPVAIDLGIVQNILGQGGNGSLFTDLMHAGFLPGEFFDALTPGGSDFILGVTFTFTWVSGGTATDIDNNGKADVAFREIYYNDAFSWKIGSTFDVQTVALHEAGHGLSQAHFGEAFRTDANGMIHFDPRAVMNAAYSGVQRTIAKTDEAGHCSNWASWPLN